VRVPAPVRELILVEARRRRRRSSGPPPDPVAVTDYALYMLFGDRVAEGDLKVIPGSGMVFDAVDGFNWLVNTCTPVQDRRLGEPGPRVGAEMAECAYVRAAERLRGPCPSSS